ncbi:MAG: cupin domain-containing protein [Pseudomonadota bacterium]
MTDRPEVIIDNEAFCQRMSKFDVSDIARAFEGGWFNKAVTTVGAAALRLGVWKGEFPFHSHDKDDELFFVIDGRLFLDTQKENGDVETHELAAGQGFVVRKGVAHRTRAAAPATVMMITGADADVPAAFQEPN